LRGEELALLQILHPGPGQPFEDAQAVKPLKDLSQQDASKMLKQFSGISSSHPGGYAY
jgi:hypothetical protein